MESDTRPGFFLMKQTCVENTGRARVSNDFKVTAYFPTVYCDATPAGL
jgi:hypothetical protein